MTVLIDNRSLDLGKGRRDRVVVRDVRIAECGSIEGLHKFVTDARSNRGVDIARCVDGHGIVLAEYRRDDQNKWRVAR